MTSSLLHSTVLRMQDDDTKDDLPAGSRAIPIRCNANKKPCLRSSGCDTKYQYGHNHAHQPTATEREDQPDFSKKHSEQQQPGSPYPLRFYSVQVEGSMQLDEVQRVFHGLLRTRSRDIYRIKAIISLENNPLKFIFQSVHTQVEESLGQAWSPCETRCCKIQVVGRNLDAAGLEAAFQTCMA